MLEGIDGGEMTQEELIEHLEHLERYTHYSEDAPALREVIEMLKCSEMPNGSEKRTDKRTEMHTCDCISRQAAIDVAMCYCPDDDGTCSKADRDIRELLDELENLPSAQPDRSLWFRIGEVCVDESKGFISAGRAVEKIRELLRETERREE